MSRSQWPFSLTPSGSSSYVSCRYTSSSWSVGYLPIVVLGGNFCHDVLYFSYLCRALRTPARPVVLPTEKDAYILHAHSYSPCGPTCFWYVSLSLGCFFLLLAATSVLSQKSSTEVTIAQKSRANPHHLLLPRVVDVLKQGRAPCVLAGLLFHTMQPHAWQPHDVSVRRHRPSVLPRLEKRDCLTALCLCSIKFLLEVYHAISRREVFHGRKYDSR